MSRTTRAIQEVQHKLIGIVNSAPEEQCRSSLKLILKKNKLGVDHQNASFTSFFGFLRPN